MTVPTVPTSTSPRPDEVTEDRRPGAAELGILALSPLFPIGFAVCMGIFGHYLPPPNMVGMTAHQLVSDFYLKYGHELSYGYVSCSVIGAIYLPWSCLLATKLRDCKGNLGPLSFMELCGGLLTTWVVMFCPAVWAACSMFADKVDPSVIAFGHAIAWYFYDVTFMVTVVQIAGFAVYVLSENQQTIFPRWVGYYSLFDCALMVPLVLIPWVGSGPFTVGGLINWWIGAATWLAWFSICSYYMLRSIRDQRGSHNFSSLVEPSQHTAE